MTEFLVLLIGRSRHIKVSYIKLVIFGTSSQSRQPNCGSWRTGSVTRSPWTLFVRFIERGSFFKVYRETGAFEGQVRLTLRQGCVQPAAFLSNLVVGCCARASKYGLSFNGSREEGKNRGRWSREIGEDTHPLPSACKLDRGLPQILS